MRPEYVETDEEYKISKLILLRFVCSAAVLRAADGHVHLVVSLLRFLQTYIFVHETQYLHYKRSKVRHFDVSHGSHHEVRIHFFSHHCVTCISILAQNHMTYVCKFAREQTMEKKVTVLL